MRKLLIGAAAIAAAVTGCSSGSEPAAPIECSEVSPVVLDRIAAGAEETVGDLTISRGAAYTSPDYGSVHFVAAEFSTPGVPSEVGVWALTSIDPGAPGLTVAADAFAQQFTVWPDGNQMANPIPLASDDINRARACLAQTS